MDNPAALPVFVAGDIQNKIIGITPSKYGSKHIKINLFRLSGYEANATAAN